MGVQSRKLSVGFLYDDTLDSFDGVAQYVKTLGAWLSSQGHHVCYLVGQTKITNWSGGTVYSLARNVPVNFNANVLSIPLPANRQAIKQVLTKENLDVLHVQMPYSPFMAGRVIAAVPPRTAVIGTFHVLPAGPMAVWGSRLLGLWLRRGLRRFDHIVSVSTAAAQFAKKTYGLTSEVVPNTVELKKFTASGAEAVKRSPGFEIIFFGRLVKRKGCQQLLQAFSQLNARLPQAKLTIAGDGPQRKQLMQWVTRHKLASSVEFLGFIEEPSKASLLGRADIACFPSLYGESFGIVLLEAMASGATVVLGGNNAGYSSVLQKRPELLIDPRDTKAFAQRLYQLLTERPLAAQLHAWQAQHVRSYDVGVVGRQLTNIYTAAIAKRKG